VSVHLIITFVVKRESVAAFRSILADVKATLPTVPGCNAVKIFNDSTHGHLFVLVERWDSEAAHRHHIDQVVSSGAWDRIASHLETTPVSSYYREM
jgi:quinol monooxygenase YgiN